MYPKRHDGLTLILCGPEWSYPVLLTSGQLLALLGNLPICQPCGIYLRPAAVSSKLDN